mgnify:CR=1 FL=1
MCNVLIKKIFQKIMPSRQDGGPVLKLFTLEDYPDMNGDRFSFYSGDNLLQGYKYFDKPPYKGIIVFFHGMGAGHNAYETLIHYFVKHGYIVYAYDNACCGDSQGEGWWNMASCLQDQECFFKYFSSLEEIKGYKVIAMGHSWGGFAAMNAVDYQVDKIVEMSGFTSVINLITSKVPLLKIFKPLLLTAQKHYYGENGLVDTADILNNSDIPTLFIQGEKDDVVPFKQSFLYLKEKLKDKNNCTFISYSDKYHQPYMSVAAQMYYRYLNESGIALGKIKNIPEIDYDKLLELDEDVLKTILDFIA